MEVDNAIGLSRAVDQLEDLRGGNTPDRSARVFSRNPKPLKNPSPPKAADRLRGDPKPGSRIRKVQNLGTISFGSSDFSFQIHRDNPSRVDCCRSRETR